MSPSGETTAIVATVLGGFSFFFLCLRCYSRFIIVRRPSFDDFFVILAFISSAAMIVLIWEEKRFGLGIDIHMLSPDTVINYRKAFWSSAIAYHLGITLAKNSAIFQCLRFTLIGRMRMICWMLLAFMTAAGLATTLVNIFHCDPVVAFWDLGLFKTKCIDLTVCRLLGFIATAITDIIVVAYPIITVKDLHVPRREKIALIMVFALGAAACIVALVRVHALIASGFEGNITESNADVALLSSVELSVSIICVCLPPLKPIVVAVWPSLLAGRAPRLPDFVDSNVSGETLTGNEHDQFSSQLYKKRSRQPGFQTMQLAKIPEVKIFPAGEAQLV